MAIITICDFERGVIAGSFMLENLAGTVSYQGVVFRSGAYAMRANPVGGATAWISWGKLGDPAVTSSALTNRGYTSAGSAIPTSLFIRTYFQWLTKPAANDEEILRINTTAGAPTLRLLLRSDGKLELLDILGTSLGVGATVLSSGVWYRLELNGNKGAAAAYELRVDGVTELSGVANQGALDMNLAILGKFANRNGNTLDVYYDDFVVDDTTWPGNGSVVNLRPDANGTFSEWTGGTGPSDYTQVDEIPPDGDTTYIASPAAGGPDDVSTFNLQSCASVGIGGGIKAIQPWAEWRREVGTLASGKIRIISGATTVDTVVTNVLTAYRANYIIYPTDPNTGLAWTRGALNALQAGVFTNDTAIVTRCTALGVFVEFDDSVVGAQPLLSLLGAGQ